MSELQVAVIGCGAMGSVHAARWAEVSGAHIAAICDEDTGAAMLASSKYGAEAHTDWRSLVGSREIDIVDICTPPNLHAEVALRAIDHRKHVLCETPLARNAAEARTIVEKAEEARVRLMTAFCHRFHPPVLFAKDLIENDDLGRIIMFRSRFSGLSLAADDSWISDKEVAGGGAMFDLAVHSIDLFRYLAGEVASATGKLATYNPKLKVEDSAALVLKSETGTLGVVEASWATPGGRNVIELYGTAGACFVDYDSHTVRYKTADMAVWETRETSGPDGYQREILHFADAVRGLQPLECTGFDGLRANEIVDDIYSQNT
jgi:predicted dehydrogenase